jgi:hypothetical protein
MNAKQLQQLLDEAGLSQRGAARQLQIDERTMRRYVAGELAVPRTVELALRVIVMALGLRVDLAECCPRGLQSLSVEQAKGLLDRLHRCPVPGLFEGGLDSEGRQLIAAGAESALKWARAQSPATVHSRLIKELASELDSRCKRAAREES